MKKELFWNIDKIKEATNCDVFNNPKSQVQKSKISTDSRTIKENDVFLPLIGENFDGHNYIEDVIKKNVNFIFCQKDKKDIIEKLNITNEITIFYVENTLKTYHQLAEYYLSEIRKNNNLKVVAITGSSGKTTCKELLKHILSSNYNVYANYKNFNNQIGVPKSVLEIDKNHDIAIIEMGAGEPLDIHRLAKIVKPDIAVITNIGRAHLEFFLSLENIAWEKSQIARFQNENDYFLIPNNTKHKDILKSCIKSKIYLYDYLKIGIKIKDDFGLDGYLLEYQNKSFKFPLIGKHNIENLSCVLTAVRLFDLSNDEIIKLIENFSNVGMRFEHIKDKFTIINDCYNANPDSMLAGLKSFNELKSKGKKIAILGDMLELGDSSKEIHQNIGKSLSMFKNIDGYFFVGYFSQYIYEGGLANSEAYTYYDLYENVENLRFHFKKINADFDSEDIVYLKASRGISLEDLIK